MKALPAFLSCVLILVSVALLKPVIDGYADKLQEARLLYSKAIQQSYHQLSQTAHEIASDPTLSMTLNWGLEKTMQGGLERYLQTGYIDSIRIIDADCHVISSTQKGLVIKSDCRKEDLHPMSKARFLWHKNDNLPQLSLRFPLEQYRDQSRLILEIYTRLDATWVSQHRQLASLWESLDLELAERRPLQGTRHDVLVWEGFSPQSPTTSYLATLISNDPLFHSLPLLFSARKTFTKQLIYTAAIFTLIFAIYFVSALRIRNRQQDLELEKLQVWTSNLIPQSGSSDANKDAKPLRARDLILLIQDSIKQLHEFYFARDRSHQQKIAELESELKEHHRHQAIIRQSLAIAERNESLKLQLQKSLHGFNQLQYESYNDIETAFDTINYGLQQSAKILFELGTQWQQELQVTHPRKFVRSLSERMNPMTGQSELEEGLHAIQLHAKNLHMIGLQSTINLQKVLNRLEQTLQISKHWENLTTDESGSEQRWFPILTEAQSLITLDQMHANVIFENLVGDDAGIENVEIPRSQLVSVVYHLYCAIIEAVRELEMPAIQIQTRLRQREGQHALICSLITDQRHVPSARSSAKSRSHLEAIRHLTFHQSINLLELPNLDGFSPLALSWIDKDESTRQATRESPSQRQAYSHDSELNSKID